MSQEAKAVMRNGYEDEKLFHCGRQEGAFDLKTFIR